MDREKQINNFYKTLVMIHSAFMAGITMFLGVVGLLYLMGESHDTVLTSNGFEFIIVSAGLVFSVASVLLIPKVKSKIYASSMELNSFEEKTKKYSKNSLILLAIMEFAVLINCVALQTLVLGQYDFMSNSISFAPIVGYIVFMAQMIKYFPKKDEVKRVLS